MRAGARIVACLLGIVAATVGLPAQSDGPPSRRIWMLLDDDGTLLTYQRSAIETGVREIWARYGVAVEWHDTVPRPEEWIDLVLLVRIGDDSMARQSRKAAEPQTLGAVMWIPERDTFRQTIFVSPRAARRILSRPGVLPDRVIIERIFGQALARIVAHEVGHIVLDMQGHAPDGLMKAQFDAGDLVASAIDHLQLGATELMRLHPPLALGDER